MRGFEMSVEDAFQFKDGTTAFAGMIDTNLKFIPSCECEILLDGKVIASIWIDGEMIVKKRSKILQRAVSTKQPIDLATTGTKGFKIRSKH